MYLRLKRVYVKLIWRGPDVSFLIPVGSCNTKKVGNQHVVTNIKFSVVVQKWPVNIHLNDKCVFLVWIILVAQIMIRQWSVCRWSLRFFIVFRVCLFHDHIEFIDFINDSDSSALIRVLTWLNNPYVPGFIFLFVSLFLLFFLFFYQFVPPFMVLTEFDVLGIFHSIFNVESKGYIVERILLNQIIVLF